MEKLTQELAICLKEGGTRDKASYSGELIREVHKCRELGQRRRCSALPDNYDSH